MKKDNDVDELKKQLEEAQTTISAMTDNWKRALADYQNLEKRLAGEKNDIAIHTTKSILGKFLEILDLIKSAGKHIKDEGLDLIVKKFQDILTKEEVLKIECLNQTFDPSIMECIEVIEGEEDGMVAEELKEGYMYKGYLLRAAKVKVFKKNQVNNISN